MGRFTKGLGGSKVKTVAAPTGGINAYNSLADMAPTDAIMMINWYPHPYGCTVRSGSQLHATGIVQPSTFQSTLMGWSAASGPSKLFAAGGGNLYDVTARAPVGAPELTGLSDAPWYHVNFANAAGTWLLAVNGLDDGIAYNGTFNRLVAGDGIVDYTWSGLDPRNASSVTIHQGRVWAVEKNTTVGWYLPTDQIWGVLEKFDFGAFFPNGGFLDSVATWSVDSGGGSSDLLVAISSHGDCVVYEGTDVGDAATWKLRGVYYIGRPIKGRDYTTKVAGDLFVLTQTGVVSLNTVFTSSQVTVSSDTVYSKKIQNLLADLVLEVGSFAGWRLVYFPAFNQLYINIPTGDSTVAMQLVANTITTAWTMFNGYAAVDWLQFEDGAYFMSPNGDVLEAQVGFADKVDFDGLNGVQVRTSVQQAYSYFDSSALQMQVSMYRPNFLVASPVSIKTEILYDFNIGFAGEPDGTTPTGVARWNFAKWGEGTWSGGLRPQKNWIQGVGLGVVASLAMSGTSQSDITWVSTDYSYVSGGIL